MTEVLEDTHLVIPGISSIINSWYKDLINKELPDQMCHPIVVMSINTLMRYKETFARFGFHKIFDSYYRKAVKYDQDGIHWSFDPLADFDIFINEHYKISTFENNKIFNESLTALGLKDITRPFTSNFCSCSQQMSLDENCLQFSNSMPTLGSCKN